MAEKISDLNKRFLNYKQIGKTLLLPPPVLNNNTLRQKSKEKPSN
jgi:hypothetical protein